MEPAELAARLIPWLQERTGVAELGLLGAVRRFDMGFEVWSYGLELADPPEDLAGPLVLRLFGPHDEGERPRIEAAFMRAVAEQGFPAPRPRITCSEAEPLGAPFLLMDRLPGRRLLLLPWQLDLTAETQHRLHGLDPEPVRRALAEIEQPEERFGIEGRIEALARRIERGGLRGLLPAIDWLASNRPSPRDALCVCHGDLWAENILAAERRVTGVIDWSAHTVSLAEPEFDLGMTAATLVAFRSPGGSWIAKGVSLATDWLSERFLRAYERHAPIDRERVLYYGLFRCVDIACSAATAAAGLPGLMRADNPRNFLTRRDITLGYLDFFMRHSGVPLRL